MYYLDGDSSYQHYHNHHYHHNGGTSTITIHYDHYDYHGDGDGVGTTMMMSAQCRLINNLADISDKAIPAKKERQEKWTPYQYHGSAHGINEMEYHVS